MTALNPELLFAFEEGKLDDEQVIELFQQIYDTEAYLWLQGYYGRVLRDLIEQGVIEQ